MMGMPFKVKAVYEYTSEHDDDLKFPIGQVINVTELEGDDWYVGDYTDASGVKHDGLFPKNFVERYEPEVPSRPARSARPKSMVQSPPPPQAQVAPQPTHEEGDEEEEEVPVIPAASKPQPPLVEIPEPSRKEEEVRSPPSASRTPVAQAPPPAPKPAPAEPVPVPAAKAGPPPVAPKSNAFKDRIAAFNNAGAAPIAPLGPKAPRNDYIKKPFVAPPPSRNAYIPPVQKTEPVHKPYIREEDPEIRQREEENHAAAEAAGLTGDSHAPAADDGEEDAPKPMSLKERMALLQKEQEAARNRHATEAPKKKPPVKKASESSERSIPPPMPAHEAEEEGEELERVPTQRQSLDVNRERPRLPSSQRRPAEPMSPLPSAPAHEILSGGEEADQSGAGEMTEDDTGTIGPGDDEDEKPVPVPRAAAAPVHEADVGDEDDTTEDAGDEEEDELDEEEQRKQRLRERMARLAGGQQGGGPFNPFGMPPAAAPASKKRSTREKQPEEEAAASAPQIPQMLAMPGMGRAMPKVRSPEAEEPDQMSRAGAMPRDVEADDENEEPAPPPRRSTTMDRGEAPPVPKDRPVPAAPQERAVPPLPPTDTSRPVPRPPLTESRPVPPPPPAAAPMSPGPGSESDDEMSMHAKRSSTEHSGIETPLPIRTGAPPVPARELPQSPGNKRASYFGNEPSSATSDKRASRVPPPVPGSDIMSPGSPRPPPPPPPTAVPTRTNTDYHPATNDETERGESDYEGDYDTDIASSAPHRDALKGHAREPSDSTTADEMTPVSSPPPLPQQNAPRAVPPPPPQAALPKSRPSMDAPRAPPPIPPPTGRPAHGDDDEYDPYNYTESSRAPPPPVPGAIPVAAPPIPPDPPATIHEESSADDLPPPGPPPPARRSTERAPPPPPAAERAPPMPPVSAQPPPPVQPGVSRSATRQSMDTQRQASGPRRSMEQSRPAGDQGQMAQDLDLSQDSQWWTAPQPLPPSLQARNGVDILSESEESQKSRRGGRTTISKDIYILYMDYSQTVITAQYDSKDFADVQLEQRHEPPPPKPRQDQLEAYWQRFGRKIAEQVGAAGHSKKDSTLGDSTPASLPLELIKAHADALLPIGTRAYGALVYANLANASILQNDEIRPGDILTVRNAKFEGHHGTMRQKYKAEYGSSASGQGHVGIVEEWDGTRRSVRVWEQGREKKGGVRSEKLRLGDLRSGEVRVWRVVGREWVGWAD